MSKGWRFWIRAEAVEAEYAPEVLDSGWIPQLPVQALDAAALITSRLVDPTAPAAAAAASPEPDWRELLARFYANQAC